MDVNIDSVEESLSSGVSRRDLLKGGGGLGLAVLLSPALLAACGGSATDNKKAALPARVVNGQPDVPTTFDPHTASQLGALTLLTYVYEGLYGKSTEEPYDIVPELAVGDPQQVDPTTVRIELRQGAKFHDGSEITAADVAGSFTRLLSPKTGTFLTGFLPMIKRVEAASASTVEIKLAYPTTLLKDRLALVRIIPAHLATAAPGDKVFNTHPIGSGPYQISSISSDLRTVSLDRFSDYNGATKISLRAIQSTVITDDQARLSALETGRIQAMTDPPYSTVKSLPKRSNVESGGKVSFQQSILIFNNGKKPFDDKRVRQAILHAINRDTITESVFFGQAEPATSPLPTTNSDYKKPTASVAYDPARARQLLSDAGASGLKMQLMVSNLGWLSPQAPQIQADLKAVGIDAKILQGETESLVKNVANKSYDAWLTVTDPSAFGNDDGQFLLDWVYGILAGFMYWDDDQAKEMATLLESALTSSSAVQVKQIVGDIQDLAADAVPSFPLHHRKLIGAWSSGLDVTPDPIYGVNLAQAAKA